ncbi:MAG: DUF4349 domain-containing protein [Armatimonadetes bacterium]|nr:DUF4349 domain-containing protein [Armatimonadota bacterium]
MKHLLVVILVLSCLFSASCSAKMRSNLQGLPGREPQTSTVRSGEESPKPAPGSEEEADKSKQTTRMVIYTATMVLEAKNPDSLRKSLSGKISALGGYVSSSSLEVLSDNRKSVNMTLRVPSATFRKVLEELSQMGHIVSQSVTGEDVTEEYTDQKSRLRNLEREEARLLEILKKANTVQEILLVEKELARVRGEIEQATGRIKYLSHQVQMATITLTLQEPVPGAPPISYWNLGGTAKDAVHALLGTIKALTHLGIWLIVFCPLFLGIWFAGKGLRRILRRPRGPAQS